MRHLLLALLLLGGARADDEEKKEDVGTVVGDRKSTRLNSSHPH